MHCSAAPPVALTLQQSALTVQLPPVGAQVLADVHVPVVVPPGMLQPRPLQQSASAVHVPLAPTQGGMHVPSLQLLEQHWFENVQEPLFGVHELGTLQEEVPEPLS